MNSLWSMITNQFAPGNLFQTICFLLILLISLPSLMLDRIVSVFETHRRIKVKTLKSIEAAVGKEVVNKIPEGQLQAILSDYTTIKFVQKRETIADLSSLPYPQLTFILSSGERVTLYPIGQDIDITRTNKLGVAIVSYWVRSPQMRARLDALTYAG